MKPSRSKLERNALMGLAAGFVLWSSVFIYRSSLVCLDGKRRFCLFDDATISMRYAWKLAHASGLVWNHGERVEGYTNLLMTLLMSAPARLLDRSSAVLSIQVLGIAFVLGTAWLGSCVAKAAFPDASEAR